MTPRPEQGTDRVDEAVSRILDRAEMEEAPSDLKGNVLRAIGTRSDPAAERGPSGWIAALRSLFEARPAPLVPFAAGLAIGVVALAVLQGGWRSSMGESTDGAMAPVPGAGLSARTKVDDQSFELGRANVRFEVFRSGDRATVSVSADAKEPVVVTIQPAARTARVERVLAIPSAAGSVEYGPGWVRIWQSGHDRAEVGLAMNPGAADAPAEIVVTSRGQSVQGSLHTGGVPAAPAKK
jgi:hypothetical protein